MVIRLCRLHGDRGGQAKNVLVAIGAGWAHKYGDDFNVTLDALLVNGRIVLREPKAEKEPEKPVKKR